MLRNPWSLLSDLKVGRARHCSDVDTVKPSFDVGYENAKGSSPISRPRLLLYPNSGRRSDLAVTKCGALDSVSIVLLHTDFRLARQWSRKARLRSISPSTGNLIQCYWFHKRRLQALYNSAHILSRFPAENRGYENEFI